MTSITRPRLSRDVVRRLLPLAAATVLLAAAVFCAWQAWVIARESAADAVVRRSQKVVAQSLTDLLQQRQARVDRAVADPQLRAALARGDVAGRAAATARAYQLLPLAQQVELYSASLDEVLGARYPVFGYAKAAQLMNVQSSGARPRLETVQHDHQRFLCLAQPISGVDGSVLGYAWIEWPFAPLQQRLDAVDPDAGRLELRQGPGSGGMMLASHGRSSAVVGDDEPGLQVADSALWVTAALPRAPVVLPRYWPLAAALALLALIGSVALLWLRVRRKPADIPEETSLSDATPPPKPATPPATPPAPPASPARSAAVAPELDPSIFRAYDIRGVVGSQLTAAVAYALGQAIGGVMHEQQLGEIVVGRDGRLSGPELAGALADGLRAAGIDVIDIGAAPTPLVYFAAYQYRTGSGVAVTGSHNPPDYNGFKIVIGGETLSEDAITDLYRRIAEGRLDSGGKGSLRVMDVVPDYLERIASDVQTERRLKVVADAGNGIAGAVAPQLLEAIGCDVIPLYCEVDGTFPNHHPDPSDPHNLEDLILAVDKTGADLGIAFDGDGDRLGVVTREGEIIYPDRLLMLFARDVLARNPGATIIYDVKCTGHLSSQILNAGGSPLMWRTGHSLIKAKMRQTEAQLAGEMSGHFFFRERWYGFDDGIYAAARLLEILAGDVDGRSPGEIFATLPKGVSTPELKVPLAEGEHYAFIERFRAQATFEGARLTTIDGVRADWPDGWGLVRASNTTPVLVLRFDADNEAALARIQQVFRTQLLSVDPGLKLPF